MKKTYESLKNKYGLPEYEQINNDFEICSISEEEDIIREIIKKMSNTVDQYINMMEDIIQPDSRFYALKEANVLDKTARERVNIIYNKLMYLNRANIELQLDYSEQKASEQIKKTFTEWQKLKKELLPIIKILKESWSKNTEIKQDGGYFG